MTKTIKVAVIGAGMMGKNIFTVLASPVFNKKVIAKTFLIW